MEITCEIACYGFHNMHLDLKAHHLLIFFLSRSSPSVQTLN